MPFAPYPLQILPHYYGFVRRLLLLLLPVAELSCSMGFMYFTYRLLYYSIPQSTAAHQQQTSPVPNKSLCSAPAVFMPVDL